VVYPSMVDAKQQVTQRFILVPAEGAVRPAGACSVALYYLAPGVLVVGQIQARRERKRGFQVPGGVAEDVVGE
jgi:hypothetical protein